MFVAIVCFCAGVSQTLIGEIFKQIISNETQGVMKFWKPFLLVLWIAGILVLLIFYIIPQEEALNNDTIQKLEKENELLTVKNVSLDEEIKKLKKQTDSLTGKIVLSHKTIQNLQNALDEKINTIDRMSALDLYEYFSGFTADSTRLKQ